MSRVGLSVETCLGLQPCFAGMDARVPRVIKLGVTGTSAVSEPRTTATAATDFRRFRDDAAFGAYGTDGHSRGFAGVDALKPHVISVSVVGTPTILIPSTTRSATTDSA